MYTQHYMYSIVDVHVSCQSVIHREMEDYNLDVRLIYIILLCT